MLELEKPEGVIDGDHLRESEASTPLNKMDYRQTEIYSVLVTQQNQELLRKSRAELEEVVRKIVNGLGIHRMPVLLALPEILRLRIGVPAKLNTWLATLSLRQEPQMNSLESIIAIEGITYGVRVHLIEDLIDVLINEYRVRNVLLLREFEKEDLEILCEKVRTMRAGRSTQETQYVESFIRHRLPNITLISSTIRIRDIINLFMASSDNNGVNPWSSSAENAATTESCTTIEWGDDLCGATSVSGYGHHTIEYSSSFDDILNSAAKLTDRPKRADTGQMPPKSELMSEASEPTDKFAEIIHSEFARNVSRIRAQSSKVVAGPTNAETVAVLENKYNLIFVENLYHLSVVDLKDIMLREKLPMAVYLCLKKYCGDYRAPEARAHDEEQAEDAEKRDLQSTYVEPHIDQFLDRVGTKYCHPLNEISNAKQILIGGHWILSSEQLRSVTKEYLNEFAIPPSLMNHILESLDDPTILGMDKVSDSVHGVEQVKAAVKALFDEVPAEQRVDVMQSFSRLFQHLLLTPEDTTKRVIKKENPIYRKLESYNASESLLLAMGYTEHEKCFLLPVLFLERAKAAHQHLTELCVRARGKPAPSPYMKLFRGII